MPDIRIQSIPDDEVVVRNPRRFDEVVRQVRELASADWVTIAAYSTVAEDGINPKTGNPYLADSERVPNDVGYLRREKDYAGLEFRAASTRDARHRIIQARLLPEGREEAAGKELADAEGELKEEQRGENTPPEQAQKPRKRAGEAA